MSLPADMPHAMSGRPHDLGQDPEADDTAAFLAVQDPVDTQAAAWLLRQQDGWSAEEAAACEAWLQADPAHRRAFAQLHALCDSLDHLPADRIAQLRLHTIAAEAPGQVSPRLRVPRRERSRVRRALPYALAATGLVAVLAGGMHWTRLLTQPSFSQTYATTRGQQLSVVLPDGSTLQLDTATTATVALYRDRREVRLVDGQAMFTVAADTDRPFEVDAGEVRATVVGTRFSVRNTDAGLGGGGVTVAVEAGRVQVRSRAYNAEGKPQMMIALSAGQSVRSDLAGRLGALQTQPTRAALLWREGRVTLDNVPLSQAVAEFERYGDTRLGIDPAVASMRISGSFELGQADAFAKALPRVLPVRLRMRDDGTDVLPANQAEK